MMQLWNLYATQPAWIWAALGAALLAIEIMTGSGWLLWAAASAGLVALATALAGFSFTTALLIFAILTIVSTLLARRYLPRSVSAGGGDINDTCVRLVGRRGAAVSAGRVLVDGKEWPASPTDGEPLKAGDTVEVTGVDGVRLTVRRAEPA